MILSIAFVVLQAFVQSPARHTIQQQHVDSPTTTSAAGFWRVEPYQFPEAVPDNAVRSHAGLLFAFVGSVDGERGLFVHSISDDSTKSLVRAPDIGTNLSWSWEDRWIAYERDGGIWVVAVDGSEASRRVTPEGTQAGSPTWSPHRQLIGYVERQEHRQDLYSVDVRNGKQTRLTDQAGFVWRPQWSPTGHEIVFYATWDGEMTDIYTVDVTTLGLTRITETPSEDFFPSWSADATMIYFVSRRNSSEAAIWEYDMQTHRERRLTDGAYVMPMASAPGGPFLVRQYEIDSHLYKVAANGKGLVKITTGEAIFQRPAASPADDVLAVITDQVGPEDVLITMNSRGQTLRIFGDGFVLHRSPRFSPTGDRIAYQASTGGWRDTNDIWIARTDGSSNQRLTDQGYMVNAIWCGGGESLVLSGRQNGFGPSMLWRGRSDDPKTEVLLQADGDLLACDCTPDGRVVYVDYSSGGPATRILKIDTGEITIADNVPESAEGVRYSLDGLSFAYLLATDGQVDVYCFDGATGEHRKLTDSPFGKSWPSWDATGEWIIFDEHNVSSKVMQILPP